jgi:hypothetical protein
MKKGKQKYNAIINKYKNEIAFNFHESKIHVKQYNARMKHAEYRAAKDITELTIFKREKEMNA